MKILNFGSLNLDYVYRVDHIATPGETITSDSRDVYLGGKGLNQSIAMARAGLSVYHAGLIGEGGEDLLDSLNKNGVDTKYIRKIDSLNGHTVIQVDKAGQNSIVLYGGTNRMMTNEFVDGVLSAFDAGDIVVLQNEINCISTIINSANSRGMFVVLNPSPFDEQIDSCNLEDVDLFFVNEIEGSQISGVPCSDPEGILAWFKEYCSHASVVLTLGENGAWYSEARTGRRYYKPALKTDVVDTTAAGDTFTGYFIKGLCAGHQPEQILEFATKAASISISRNGASTSIPNIEEVII